MYSTSTQKKHWTFSSVDEIDSLRKSANDRFREKFSTILKPGEQDVFLTPYEESQLRRIVSETGIRFAEDFRPPMWPSTRWTAFAYFKRFFLHHSTMEYSPKSVMMGCYYLAAKVDEFYLSIDEFVKNLRSGSNKTNSETVLSFEPQIMRKLNYQLTVHSPFRPFEGHLIEMKTRALLGFDLEQVRPHANEFFKKALYGDVMLLYSPSQIALAALKYSFQKLDKAEDLLKDQFLYKLLEIDTWKGQSPELAFCDKLMSRIDELIKFVVGSCKGVTADENSALQARIERWVTAFPEFDSRLSAKDGSPQDSSVVGNDFSDDD